MNRNKKTIVNVKNSMKFKYITFHEGIENIGDEIFKDGILQRVHVPTSTKSIGTRAFSKCEKLTNIVLEEGLETIDSSCFAETRISKIIIPSNVLKIGDYCF